jgi:hypothetical protein
MLEKAVDKESEAKPAKPKEADNFESGRSISPRNSAGKEHWKP